MPRSADHVGERQDFGAQRLAAREGKQLAHQIGGAIGVLLDVHDVGEGRIGRAVLGEQQIGEADDGGQHIVEVMRDAAGQLADRLHLLALRQLHFERLVLRRVARDRRGSLRPCRRGREMMNWTERGGSPITEAST